MKTASRTVTGAAMDDFSCDSVMKLDEGSIDIVNGSPSVIGLGRDVLKRMPWLGGHLRRWESCTTRSTLVLH